jgi:2-polyprenyl-3-methyl-5-hydroxy-6-metoxy-1,4-benzoquinol methylase
MKSFTSEPLTDILAWMQAELTNSDTLSFEVLNPDIGRGEYAGTPIILNETKYLFRSIKAWSDLSELLFCRLLVPKIATEHTVILTYEKLDLSNSFHHSDIQEEKYGTESVFAAIRKNEEPVFLSAYLRALKSVKVETRKRILNLGINTGDEFDLIRQILSSEVYQNLSLVGVDFSSSAINVARKRFDEGNAAFYVHDINDLASLKLGRFDLIITIGTLQSTTLEFKKLFASLVQEYLNPDGAMILGFPNCRWMGGEMIYGAKAPNYPYSEMSILIKDIYYCKKYLQQKKFRVTLTGSDYLFLTATKIGL